MITEQYLKAYNNFLNLELELTAQYKGNEYAKRIKPYYTNMVRHINENPDEYILFKDSSITYYEMEFMESVVPIRDVLLKLAEESNISNNILFIPRIKIEEGLWDQIINVNVEQIVRKVFDETEGEDFETLRKFKAFDRRSPISRWIKSKNGRNFLFEFQVSVGIRQEMLIKKRLYLFDKEFVRQQMMWMSQQIWIHKKVIEAFENWEHDKKLWNNIDHLKRKIELKEILDESRPEIKFLRMLEKAGLKGQFIHDQSISWQLKYRPDFWFLNENLIVEYDEIAHKFQIQEDFQREKIIKAYIPNIRIIRVKEGYEQSGLLIILDYLKNFRSQK